MCFRNKGKQFLTQIQVNVTGDLFFGSLVTELFFEVGFLTGADLFCCYFIFLIRTVKFVRSRKLRIRKIVVINRVPKQVFNNIILYRFWCRQFFCICCQVWEGYRRTRSPGPVRQKWSPRPTRGFH